ncbi:MAG: NAD(P)-dependent dehydrogenase (short-subunit alcohol dehydrogenase family) [bacterium]
MNISSGTALHTPPLQGVYAASKAALDRICWAYQMELKDFGISVMQIHSIGIATEMRKIIV